MSSITLHPGRNFDSDTFKKFLEENGVRGRRKRNGIAKAVKSQLSASTTFKWVAPEDLSPQRGNIQRVNGVTILPTSYSESEITL